jgi:hypothetical protein
MSNPLSMTVRLSFAAIALAVALAVSGGLAAD